MTQAFSQADPIGVESDDQTQLVTILNPWGLGATYGYQPESNSPTTINMVNGLFTLTTAEMLADFVQLTTPTSLSNMFASRPMFFGSAMHFGALPTLTLGNFSANLGGLSSNASANNNVSATSGAVATASSAASNIPILSLTGNTSTVSQRK